MKKQIILIGLFTSTIIHAQESKLSNDIEEITMVGKFLNLPYEKTNENILVITKKDLEKSTANSVDEILQQTLGVDVRRRGSNGVQSDVSIRGGNFEQTMILINGVRMNDSQTGHNSMHIPVDLHNIDRIEVIKGPAARRFGNNAYGGVINIITKASSKKAVTVTAQGGDFSTGKLGVSANFGNEKISYLVQANSDFSEGYRHNTDYEINNVFFQNQIALNNAKLKFQAGFSEKKFGANGFYATPTATEQYEEMQASIVSVGFEKKISSINLNSKVHWRRGQDMYLYNRQKPEVYRNMHIGNNIGGEINASYQSKLGTSGIGIEVLKEILESNNLGSRERFLTQVFAEHHLSLFENKLQITPGISWAHFSKQGHFFYPGIDLGFNITQNHKVYGNFAKVNRVPTFTDLFYNSATEIGNENLVPEEALSFEIGYRFLKDSSLFKASYFGRETKNGIDWVKSNTNSKWNAMNVGAVSTQGFETEFGKKFNGFVSNISLGYIYLDVKMETKNQLSKYVMDHFKHQMIGKLENQFLKNFMNQLTYRFQERTDKYHYHIVDEKLSYRLANLDLYILINNLTNEKYVEAFGVPMSGRWFHIGVKYRIL